MTMDRLQVLVWFLMPIFALFLMIALMGARGGAWVAIPIVLLAIAGLALYLMILRVRANERARR